MPFRCLSQRLNGRTYLITGSVKDLDWPRNRHNDLGAIIFGISRHKPMLDHPSFQWYGVDLSDPQASTIGIPVVQCPWLLWMDCQQCGDHPDQEIKTVMDGSCSGQ